MILRKTSLSIAVLAAGLGLAACGASTHSSSGAAGTGTGTDAIVIKNFAYSPSDLIVKPGATVTVKNEDSSTHTVTADGGAFNTGNISPGHSATFKAPATAGTYPYHCAIHNFMRATIKVSG